MGLGLRVGTRWAVRVQGLGFGVKGSEFVVRGWNQIG